MKQGIFEHGERWFLVIAEFSARLLEIVATEMRDDDVRDLFYWGLWIRPFEELVTELFVYFN